MSSWGAEVSCEGVMEEDGAEKRGTDEAGALDTEVVAGVEVDSTRLGSTMLLGTVEGIFTGIAFGETVGQVVCAWVTIWVTVAGASFVNSLRL